MFLSDRDIHARLADGSLGVFPMESADLQVQPATIDLRLGAHILTYNDRTLGVIDTRAPIEPFETLPKYLDRDGEIMVFPGDFFLATTIESVNIPFDLAGIVHGRSSVARTGIQVHAAGFIDPGFVGNITLEMFHMGKIPVKLYVGMRIAQIAFETLSSPAERPYGSRPGSKYQFQTYATRSMISEDL